MANPSVDVGHISIGLHEDFRDPILCVADRAEPCLHRFLMDEYPRVVLDGSGLYLELI